MKQHFNFENKMVNAMTTEKNKFSMIKSLVFKCCLSSGFLSNLDKKENTSKYQWFEEVFMRNFYSLNLLETIMENKYDPQLTEDVDRDIKLKASLIIKDIARRLVSDPMDNVLSGAELNSGCCSSINSFKSTNKLSI
ncbi:hypothetical protein A0H77_12620 [Vibrio alginolyticus]|uniref:hypothetical protein n=2 Tax=Vibrio TaxID=662 RepID=UPI00079B9C10|nr:hypothetical protein A0H77_12620 [Vibrio alginolyticus]OPH49440.1 hypothetical protein B4U81_20705 [Vibrio campbellii]HCG5275148.1 hypothetical protein [Vibrio parahaemolyticus]